MSVLLTRSNAIIKFNTINHMKTASLIFPHQLFENSPLNFENKTVFLIEEFLFFKQYKFHQQKIAFHRASMKFYADYLSSENINVNYIESTNELSDIRSLIEHLGQNNFEQIDYIDTVDNWLEKRIQETSTQVNIHLNKIESPLFINTNKDLETFFHDKKKKFFQTSFYISERKRLDILLEAGEQPTGGKWSFDDENRKKYPKEKTPPPYFYPNTNNHHQEAFDYVNKNFSKNYGFLSDAPIYPTDFESAKTWFNDFLIHRFYEFGIYEDAIVKNEVILNHSILSPLINTGLLTPKYIIEKTLAFAEKENIPLNSTEGFIRQIIGWREFIRGVYVAKGTYERTTNFWNFKRRIPKSFYDGTTGIEPIDDCIKKVLKNAYNHHIERLMILGNFMLLCEFDPDEVYKWFMELYIDAYDWVMVPNVYGMSQFADGGVMSTKPYISGSNYIIKMSDYKKGDWQAIWDGLFWHFMDKQRAFFKTNPRLNMLVSSFDKMPPDKKEHHLKNAQNFFNLLDGRNAIN